MDEFTDPRKLRQLVLMDDLTGLFNRRYFRLRLSEEEKRSKKHGKKFSLIMIDVNRFKEINDEHGHIAGDRILLHIGNLLKESVREEDIVCRWAGDEFVVILPEAGDKDARKVARRILSNVAKFSWREKCQVPVRNVSLSLGFAVFPEDAEDLASLIQNADRALYGAKSLGKPLRFGARDRRAPGESERRAPLEVYGKRRELDYLRETIERAKEGEPQFSLVRGEMGVGKTFLVERLEEEVGKLHMIVLCGRCSEDARDIPFSPIRDLLTRSLDHAGTFDLIASVNLPEASLAELARLAPRWTNLGPAPGPQKKSPGQDRFLLFHAFHQLLVKLSEVSGVVVVVEDMQWADLASLSLLQFLARTIETGRIAVIATSRPPEDLPMKGREALVRRELMTMSKTRPFQSVSLSPLSPQESDRMIGDLLGQSAGDAFFREELHRISKGNPFFIRGMVDFLKKSGKAPGRLEEVPPTIQEAIERRIEKLSAEAREAFRAASVLGNEFEFDVLLSMLHTNEGFLLDIIDQGIQANIIEEVPDSGGDRYAFVQSVIAKVLSSHLTGKARKMLHLEAGLSIEHCDPEGKGERYGELAYHFRRGGDAPRAFSYFLKAARRARELYAYQESLVSYAKAMKLAKIPVTGASEGDMLEIVEERGLVYQQVGDYRRAKKDFEKALELASSLGNREKVGRALKNLSSIYIYRRQFEEAYECSLKTLRHAMGTDDTGLEADSLAAFGNIYLFSGRYDRALKFYHEALERDRKNHDRMRASKITMNLGVIHWYKEEYTLAQSYYQLSLEMLRESGDRTFQPLCLNNIALICLQRGLFSRALALCQEALTLSKETGNTTIEAYSYNHISEIYQRIGAYSRALEWIRKAVGLIARVKDRGSKADFLRNRGVAHFLSGDHDKAREDLTKALAVARGSGKREYEMNTLYWLVALLVARGERSEARKYLAEFEEIRDSRDAHEYRMKYAIAASLLHLSGGKPREALGCLDALCLTGAEVNPHLRMIYHLQRALALRASGREGDAKSEAHAAWKITLSLAKKIGDKSLRAGFLKSADAMRIREIIGAAPPLS